MAEIQSIQCPKCGSPLEITPSTTRARCSYCGSVLRVSRDALGQSFAVLDDIREDTDILATDVVRRRLEERLEGQLVALYDLRSEYHASRENEGGTFLSWLNAAAIGMWALLFGVLWWIIAFLSGKPGWYPFQVALVGGIIAVLLVERKRKAALAKLEEEYGPPLSALEADVAETAGELGAVTARMDGLITDAGGH